MIVLWVTLLVLHQGYALIPVITVQSGEPATLRCTLHNYDLNTKQLYWYKQSAGDTLKLILKLYGSGTPQYGPEFSPSRLNVHTEKNFSNLTILRTTQEDEGMYHCAAMEWINPEWNGIYLLVKGNTERTSNYTVVQRPPVSDPVRPGDSVTLQCSILSDYKNKTCPGVHSVYWFRAGSNASRPDFIYTDGNSRDECSNNTGIHSSPKSCVYSFSKNISSSDAGTYYCAVATCGEILFGNGTKLELVQTTHSLFIGIVISIVCLTISVVANVVFICNRSLRVCEQYKGMESTISEARHDNLRQPVHDITEVDDRMNYAALNFSERKATRGRKKKEFSEDCVYSTVEYRLNFINSDSVSA
ncbi:prostaglandin F2 receptor negative regulator-like [Thunnus maccoyii]|uniref:prostaglandin F2 receptor negative regulator-like n=1 Tax=Thunnus maccoyii TaxID=8240 RepID=UPI001C4C5E3F|nr:prostaglandin F2 receptor negative regulator-like [Thunnus maccoyii]